MEERKLHDRVYDYAPYNDLARPILSGSQTPYPRRCQLWYLYKLIIVRGERRRQHQYMCPFEEMKQATFSAGRLRGVLHNLIPQIAATLSTWDVSFGYRQALQ
ncbi:hypothetical protein V2J09_016145 [Rumex salicifolius]